MGSRGGGRGAGLCWSEILLTSCHLTRGHTRSRTDGRATTRPTRPFGPRDGPVRGAQYRRGRSVERERGRDHAPLECHGQQTGTP